MESESTQLNSEESDIGPPPRVILEDEEDMTAAQNTNKHGASHDTKSNLDTSNRTLTHSQDDGENGIQKCPIVSPSGLDLGSLTCINGTKVSPGFSSFETFKPKALNRKQRCDSPIHKPLEDKTILNTHKSLPASRLPKPKVYTTKTKQIKPPLIRRSAQYNLSSLTSIKKEATKPKKVPPPVPPRHSSLSTISKTSLEEYADKLGKTEPQVKSEQQRSSVKESVDKLNNPVETECSKDTNKVQISSKNENNRNKSSRRNHCIVRIFQ